MDFLKVDPGLMIWTWVSFGVLLLLLSKFALPGFLKGLEDRETALSRAIEKAAEVDRRLEHVEEEGQALLKNAQREADELLRQARHEAEQLRASLLKAAEEEQQALLESARLRAEEERAAALSALRGELAVLVASGAESLVGRSFTSDEDRAWSMDWVQKI